MSMSINTSTSSLQAQTSILGNQKSAQATLAKLSSGSRINSAQDDAAGLAVGVGLIARLNSANEALSNAGDALSLADTTDAALGDSTDILSRLDELAMQAGSGALSNSDRGNIQVEADALTSELDRVAHAAEFNGTSLLSSIASLGFQVGVGASAGNVPANDQIAITTGNATSAALGVAGVSLATQSAAQSALGSIGSALQAVSATRATLGAEANRAASAIQTVSQTAISLATANSSIRDADMAAETSNLSRDLILGQAGAAVLAQANQNRRAALRLLGSH